MATVATFPLVYVRKALRESQHGARIAAYWSPYGCSSYTSLCTLPAQPGPRCRGTTPGKRHTRWILF